MIASLKLGLICVSSCSMARTTGYEYKKKSGLESRDPGIGERSGFQSRDSKSFGIDTTNEDTPIGPDLLQMMLSYDKIMLSHAMLLLGCL